MSTIEIKTENALKAFAAADKAGKNLLENLFGKKVLRTILERVQSFEDACEENGTTPTSVLSGITDPYKAAEARIEEVAKALREGKPASECWYYPWFERSSGGGFSYDDFVGGRAFSAVGARLRVDTPEKALNLGNIMLADYQIYLSGK